MAALDGPDLPKEVALRDRELRVFYKYTTTADMALYDLMKTAYASRL